MIIRLMDIMNQDLIYIRKSMLCAVPKPCQATLYCAVHAHFYMCMLWCGYFPLQLTYSLCTILSRSLSPEWISGSFIHCMFKCIFCSFDSIITRKLTVSLMKYLADSESDNWISINEWRSTLRSKNHIYMPIADNF